MNRQKSYQKWIKLLCIIPFLLSVAISAGIIFGVDLTTTSVKTSDEYGKINIEGEREYNTVTLQVEEPVSFVATSNTDFQFIEIQDENFQGSTFTLYDAYKSAPTENSVFTLFTSDKITLQKGNWKLKGNEIQLSFEKPTEIKVITVVKTESIVLVVLVILLVGIFFSILSDIIFNKK
jgi:hypothetical protein